MPHSAGTDPTDSTAYHRLAQSDRGVATAVHRSLAMTVDTADDVLELMGRVASLAVRYVPGADHAGITLAFATVEPFTVGPTDAAVDLVDREQYAADDGPCLRASRTNDVVDMSLSAIGALWPDIAISAHTAGIGRIVAYPVHLDVGPVETIGSLNLYSDAGTVPGSDDHQDVLAVLLHYLDSSLRTFGRQSSVREAVRALQDAMDARQAIDTAAGVLMVRNNVDLAGAISELGRTARERKMSLREAARAVLDSLT